MRMQKILAKGIVSLSLVLSLSGCASAKNTSMYKNMTGGKTYQYTNFVMDTVLSETIYGAEEDCTKDLQSILKALEEKELSWRLDTSEIAKMNQVLKSSTSYKMSDQMTEWMNRSLNLAKDSEGAFDPTIGELAKLWNIEGENPQVPSAAKIHKALGKVGYKAIQCKGNTINIEETRSIDLGAAGKGIATDEAYGYLSKKKDVTGAVIAVGGSILTYGEKEDGSDWNVAIQDPEAKDGSAMGVLHLKGTNYISTSGDYEKYFIQDGKKYHHILDAKTGYPSDKGISSVTVVCDNGLLSDGLSTACFILGIEDSKPLLEKYNASAIFITDKNEVNVLGDVAKEAFEIINKNYVLK